jgi:DNA-binding transcriptional ArsR family regulator
MAPDLLSTIRREIDERLSELRPLLAEYERLGVAADALVAAGRQSSNAAVAKASAPAKRTRRERRVGAVPRGSALGTIELSAAAPGETVGNRRLDKGSTKRLETSAGKPAAPRRSPAKPKPKPERAARGAAREAILAALDHGSHTVGELAVVTAMSGPNISGNMRKLVSEGAVVKTEREGKAAWTLADVTI